jgi:hypothetical protein
MRTLEQVRDYLETFFKRCHPGWLRELKSEGAIGSKSPGGLKDQAEPVPANLPDLEIYQGDSSGYQDGGAESPTQRWPLSIPLRPPTDREALEEPEKVRNWIGAFRALPGGLGEVKWSEVNWRYMGKQIVPQSLLVPDPETVARWIGFSRKWDFAVKRYSRAVSLFPKLSESFAGCRFELFEMEDPDFTRLLNVLSWLRDNPRSNLYPRELPISGIDSKWLDSHKRSISATATPLLGVNVGGRDFYGTLGLKTPPALLRLKPLDHELRKSFGGWSDLSVTLEDLQKSAIKPRIALIVENLQTGLSIKDISGAVLFMRLGYSVDLLGELPWLKNTQCLYWGDIDTHGFAILSRARGYLPQLKSMLMDTQTFLDHKDLWGTENTPYGGAKLSLLTPGEEELFQGLKSGRWGNNLRLEQERIAWELAWPLIEKAAGLC